MKKGWKIKTLNNFLDVQNGYAFASSKFSGSNGMPLIRIRDLKNGINTKVNFTGEYSKQFVVQKGDFLIGMDGEFRCYEWVGCDALLNQRVCRLQNFKDNLFAKFLFYGINKYLKEIEDVTTFTTVKHISSQKIKNIEFPIPPLIEQKQIVTKLDQAFAAIDTAKLNIEKNLENSKELFQSKLNEVFAQKGEGWVGKSLGEVCEVTAGQSPRGEYYNDDGVGLPFYQGKKEFQYKYIGEPKKWTSVTTKEANKDDILMSVRAPVGPINFATQNICIGRGLASIRAGNLVNKDYLYYFLIDNENKLVSNVGAVFDSINKDQIKAITIPTPSLEKQTQIINFLDSFNNKTQSLESKYQQELNSLEELKKSILEKAFNGEL